MSGIAWQLLQPVDTGAQVQQGFQTGAAMVKGLQTRSALGTYLSNPDDPQAFGALAYLDPQTADAAQRQHLLRRKSQMEQQERQRRTALGGLYTKNPQAAREEAIASGDFDLAETFSKLDETQQKKTADFWGQAGALAFKLKQTPDPQARMALWAEARPMLEAQGAPAEMLDRFDPTNDTQLEAAITTSQKIGDLIEQGRVKWHQQGERPSFATDFMGRPVGTQNPYGQGGGGSGGGGSASDAAPEAVVSTLSGALPAPVVAGFLGNFEVEGGYGGASGDSGKAKGIAQWHSDRLANYQRAVGRPFDPADHEGQARFVLWEMQNPEAAGMTTAQRDAILAAKTPAEAAELIDKFYERSSGKARQKRVAAANRYGGGGPVRVASKADYDKLAVGTPYIAPDGSRRVKS